MHIIYIATPDEAALITVSDDYADALPSLLDCTLIIDLYLSFRMEFPAGFVEDDLPIMIQGFQEKIDTLGLDFDCIDILYHV